MTSVDDDIRKDPQNFRTRHSCSVCVRRDIFMLEENRNIKETIFTFRRIFFRFQSFQTFDLSYQYNRVPQLIPVLGSQPAGDVSHKSCGRLPLLSARPAVTYQFRCLVNRGTMGVNSLPKTVTRKRRDCDLNPGPSAPESSMLTTRLPSHPINISILLFHTKKVTTLTDIRDKWRLRMTPLCSSI